MSLVMVGAGLMLTILAFANLTPGDIGSGYWLIVGVVLVSQGLVLTELKATDDR